MIDINETGSAGEAVVDDVVQDWTQRVILGNAIGNVSLPAWLHDSYATLRTHVMSPAYPCFFGTIAEKRGEMFYSFVHEKNIDTLAATMAKFAELALLPQYEKNNIAIFFEPDAVPLGHQQYHDIFWDTLQHLHDHDPDPTADQQPAPDDPKWEFSFAGVEMFVVCATPSFTQRHSRNLGPGMVLLFQPRSVFVDKVTNRVIGQQARDEVRRRLKKWDALPAHPDLGFYGDPGNLEWKQYFLPDENVAAVNKCPFLNRASKLQQDTPVTSVQSETSAIHGSTHAANTQLPAALAEHPAQVTENAVEAKKTDSYSEEMRDISRRYAAMPQSKRDIFRAGMAVKQISSSLLPILPLENRSSRMPLSYAQERLWFLWKLDPASSAYNVPQTVKLQGKLDCASLRQAISEIVARHDILHTRFEQSEDTPLQIIDPDLAFEWAEINLQAHGDQKQQEELDQHLHQLSIAAFDLEHGPLLRVALIKLNEETHVLHFVMHHIVCDAWSYALLVNEFTELYEAIKEKRAASLTALQIQYADFSAWQKEWADEKEMDKQLAYWKQRLGNEHPILALPASRLRKGASKNEGGRVRKTISAENLQKLTGLSQQYGVTMSTILLAVYDVLLYRYSGQNEIRVGIPVAGRNRQETEALIGFFVNTLVIRADLTGSDTFEKVLQQVHARMMEAQSNQDLPFAKLVDVLQPQRSIGHTPLFQAMFNFSSKQTLGRSISGLTVTSINIDQETVKFDLTLNAIERETSVALAFSYAKDRFDEAVIARMAGDYMQILEKVAEQASIHIGAVKFGDGSADVSTGRTQWAFKTIAERICETARHFPLSEAIHCEGKRMSYVGLHLLSNRIANKLKILHASPDERIGVCVERSPELVAAMLGIMKAGSAFVPLDPSYPMDRLNYMLGNAGIRRVLTDRNTLRKFPDLLDDFDIISVNDVDHVSAADTQIDVHPDQLAYVIYTSGSTGHPKGVAISHRALSLHMDDFISTHKISADDKVLNVSTINFDVALHEIFPALIQGGKVEMRGPEAWDLDTTNHHLINEEVTFSRLPTAYWQQWLRELPNAESLKKLRQITVGGEALNGDALRLWKNSPLKSIAVANLYGPTETTVACMFKNTEMADAGHAIVPIGASYPSRQAYVMDAEVNELPVLATGELCIAGDTLARGYLERPDLTAEKFIPDPFSSTGGRLYRTGDICRKREDSTIEYFGRKDKQIKLRGFRIELGEIENVLRSAPDVRQAVVELSDDSGEPRLLAFVVGSFHRAEVVSYLQRHLPDYMVPSVFIKLDALPLMQNGKINRDMLPKDNVSLPVFEKILPRSELEQQLFSIWQTVLKRQDFGVTNNFFEMGGNSLSALRVAAMAKNQGIANFRLDTFFRHPTIAAFAAQFSKHNELANILVPLNATRADRNIFVLHPSSGLVFDYRDFAQELDDVANVYGLQFPFEMDAKSWPEDFHGLASYYVKQMRSMQPHGPYSLIGWSSGGLLATEIAHLLEESGESLAFIGIVDAKTPVQRKTDLSGKNKDLRRIEAAESSEIDQFWNDLKQHGEGWDSYLLEQENPRRIAENMVLASKYILYVTSGGHDRQIKSDIYVWWSSENATDLGAGRLSEWGDSSQGQLIQMGVIDASHRDIVKNKQFAEDVKTIYMKMKH